MTVDFDVADAMERVRQIVRTIEPHDSVERYRGLTPPGKDTIHVYPTMAEANRFAAGAWKRAHAPQGALRWAERFFAWRRG